MNMKLKMSVQRGLLIAAVLSLLLFGGYWVWAQMGPGTGPGPGAIGSGQMGQMGAAGPGCHMMGGSMMGGQGMMSAQGTVPKNIDEAAQITNQYLASYRQADLVVKEVMEFSNHFYVLVGEKSTGIAALELLIDKITGTIHPEPQSMMWNTKYSPMGGGMGGGMMGMGRFRGAAASAQMPVTLEQAKQSAQRFLTAYLSGATPEDEVVTFYGYYTIDVLRDGKVFGMLSVNGYTGQVWYHNWHGAFVGMKEF